VERRLQSVRELAYAAMADDMVAQFNRGATSTSPPPRRSSGREPEDVTKQMRSASKNGEFFCVLWAMSP